MVHAVTINALLIDTLIHERQRKSEMVKNILVSYLNSFQMYRFGHKLYFIYITLGSNLASMVNPILKYL